MRAEVLLMVMCLIDGNVTGCLVLKTITVSKLSKVNISCPSVVTNSSERKYLLLFNGSCINYITTNKALNYPENFFGHFEVTANNSGLYQCKVELVYPPPHSETCHTTVLKVADKPEMNETVAAANQSCPVKTPFIPDVVMWAGCGVLLVYSLLFTCITIVLWRKLKRDDDDTNVYINTRPGDVKKPYKV
ncbi:T-cell-specific surface glycoprotein CD28-like isoform X2 [Morone saxatilis]|nr:T-cell-specific surface glycoprotein CD28-like isoform X2 [Morone saxatilis]